MQNDSFEIQGIVLSKIEKFNILEVLSVQGLKYKCFVNPRINKILSLGALGKFLLTHDTKLPVIKSVFVQRYPKSYSILDLEILHSLVHNLSSLVQIGSGEPELYQILSFYLSNHWLITCPFSKKIFFRALMVKALSQIGLLPEQMFSSGWELLDDLSMDFSSDQDNLSRGFTTEKFDAKITLLEVLVETSKEFDLNLAVI